MNAELLQRVSDAVIDFVRWLDSFGETSQDHQDFYAGELGRRAKSLYYRKPVLGTLAVAPMVLCEAFVPRARALFYPRSRLPIADAHFAMGFASMFEGTQKEEYYHKAVHFLEVLKRTRCPDYRHYAWGYPFHWQTRGGLIPAGTPLITTIPYCYEAFEYVFRIDGKQEWQEIMHSIAEHALHDYRDIPAGDHAATCTYTPLGGERVVNASAYRAFLLTRAGSDFKEDGYLKVAERNLNFVLQHQQDDGSWLYAMDGTRDFVDHFHTCFVLKALVKIEQMTGHDGCTKAIDRGIEFYLSNLFDEAGLPRPFARAPRLTVYRHELYDYAECLNLGVLLQGRFPELDRTGERVLQDLLDRWLKRDGSFKSRELLIGFDNVPMHRWGQSEIFRSLCLMLTSTDRPQTVTATVR